jgi:EAL domain-containing protein (putative c-di-GMP-specific phosphodiesterase class I)
VFDRIVEQVKEWAALPKPFSIAVNVSPQVLSDQDFLPRLKKLKSALDELGFALTIEITEDYLVQGGDSSLVSLERVRKLGVDLSIDDFGKGYSSLSYLKQIPATEIKIDRRFIGTIAIDGKDKQIVKTVIELAHAFDMRVVAEGIDNAEALFVLRGLGCEMAQGFFIGRPMRGDVVLEWHDHYVANATVSTTPAGQLRLARAKT